jgi:hypothetical protein
MSYGVEAGREAPAIWMMRAASKTESEPSPNRSLARGLLPWGEWTCRGAAGGRFGVDNAIPAGAYLTYMLMF